SLAFAVELAASGWWAELPRVLGWMALVHAVIGLGEAMITGLVLRSVLAVRPDLVFGATADDDRSRGWGRGVLGGLPAAPAGPSGGRARAAGRGAGGGWGWGACWRPWRWRRSWRRWPRRSSTAWNSSATGSAS